MAKLLPIAVFVVVVFSALQIRAETAVSIEYDFVKRPGQALQAVAPSAGAQLRFLTIIEAAVYAARALGYRKLVLFGHSLGNIQIQFYSANNWDTDIKAVVLAGMFAHLPWKSRRIGS